MYKSKIKLGVEDTPYNRYYLSKIDDPLQRKIYVEKIAPPGKKDHIIKAADGVALVRKGLYAFMAETSTIYKIMEDTYFEHEKCGLEQIEYLKYTRPHIAIKKRSPFKEILKVK